MTRLLMLEPDDRLIAAVVRTLEQERFEVVPVKSAASALQKLSTDHFDAALLDGDLLDESQLTEFLRVPIVLATSFLGREGRQRFLREAQLLQKPFTSAQLLAALRAATGVLSSEPSGLVEALRRAHGARQTLTLSVGDGFVYLEAGELVHAEIGGLRGERALAEIFAHGSKPFTPHGSRATERSIHQPFQELMLSVLCAVEEGEQRGGGLERSETQSSGCRGKAERS